MKITQENNPLEIENTGNPHNSQTRELHKYYILVAPIEYDSGRNG